MSPELAPASAPGVALTADVAQLQAELAQVRAEMQDLMYTVSHDLRAPLRHINAFAQIVQEDLPDAPPDILSHLLTIRQSAQLLTQQLDGLAMLSRLGQQPVDCQAVDGLALVQAVVAELMQRQAAPNVQWQLAHDLPQLWVDPKLLHQVLLHVLDNALKFSRSRDPACVEVSWQGLAPVLPGQAGLCEIRVRDNGVGFAPAQADQLFKVFARLHPVRAFEGLGLGLVSCRKMLARMGGSIRADAQPNEGCCVILKLPMLAPTSSTSISSSGAC